MKSAAAGRKPNSVRRRLACADFGGTIIPLGPALLTGSSDLPGSFERAVLSSAIALAGNCETSPPYLVLLRAGFCLPSALQQTRCALTAPFHPYPAFAPYGATARRYFFCATSPSGYPDRALPGALPCGVRTFLSPYGKRSSGPLRQAIVLHGPAKAGRYRSHPSVSCRIAYCSSFL